VRRIREERGDESLEKLLHTVTVYISSVLELTPSDVKCSFTSGILQGVQ